MEPTNSAPALVFYILSLIFPGASLQETKDIGLSKKPDIHRPAPSYSCQSSSVRSSHRVEINGKVVEDETKEWKSPTNCNNTGKLRFNARISEEDL